MKTILMPVALLTALILSPSLMGQQFDEYGVSMNRETKAQTSNTGLFNLGQKSNQSKPGPFSGLFKRSDSNQSTFGQTQPKFSMPKVEWPKLEMPKLKMPKFEWPKMNAGGGGLFKRPSWLPERDPNAPTLLEKMNTKSKAFIDRTTGWMAGKSAELSEKRTASWDMIRRDMERIKSQAQDSTLTPPTRSADNSAPRMRY